MRPKTIAAACAMALLGMAGGAGAAQALKPVVLAQGLDNPWAVAFLPDGRMLVTEKPGRLRIVDRDGKLSAPLEGLPPIDARGQCGLLDVVLDPNFASNRRIFFTFAEPAGAGQQGNSSAVGRARLGDGDRLTEVVTIFSQKPKVSSAHHCGSRIAFGGDGLLYVGLGDRFSRMADAQDPTNHLGKVVRIDADGRAPADNPFAKTAGAAPEVWSLGHRNVQGLAFNPVTGELWESEHGPQGGDEINVIDGGKNYGWPLVTWGKNYGTGTRIGDDPPKAGFETPLKWWVPTSIAPSGMAFVTGSRYPAWQGSLLIGTLRAQALVRLTLDGRTVTGEERIETGLKERLRDVRISPEGFIVVVTDGSAGQVVRLEPR